MRRVQWSSGIWVKLRLWERSGVFGIHCCDVAACYLGYLWEAGWGWIRLYVRLVIWVLVLVILYIGGSLGLLCHWISF